MSWCSCVGLMFSLVPPLGLLVHFITSEWISLPSSYSGCMGEANAFISVDFSQFFPIFQSPNHFKLTCGSNKSLCNRCNMIFVDFYHIQQQLYGPQTLLLCGKRIKVIMLTHSHFYSRSLALFPLYCLTHYTQYNSATLLILRYNTAPLTKLTGRLSSRGALLSLLWNKCSSYSGGF